MELHIVSGFLGAGKTTFLNSYLPLLEGKTVVIENEAGDIGIDGTLLPGDVPVRELSAGCICCTLAGELHKELALIAHKFKPDQIVMEPSGIGALTDIEKHCKSAGVKVSRKIVLVDASAFWTYEKGFGHFFLDQISKADLLLMSHLGETTIDERKAILEEMRRYNPSAVAYLDDWRELDAQALSALVNQIENTNRDVREASEGDSACSGVCAVPEKTQDFAKTLLKGCATWNEQSAEQIAEALHEDSYGTVLRVKGYVTSESGERYYFSYTPTEWECRTATDGDESFDNCAVIIGCDLHIPELRKLFGARQSL